MVRTPSAVKTAGGFRHAGDGRQCSRGLPVGAAECLDMREARQQQACRKGRERQHDTANERLAPQTEDGEAGKHHSLIYRVDGTPDTEF